MGIDPSTDRRLLLLRSGGAGGFLTNENTMDENLRESRLTPWTRPNN
jgi:hypothetical protein